MPPPFLRYLSLRAPCCLPLRESSSKGIPHATTPKALLGGYTLHRSRSQRRFRRPFSTTSARQSTASPPQDHVRIVEVGPRDGLQNEKSTVSLETKIELVRRLAETGVKDMEAGSFVRSDWVPQMANSADVLNYILGHPPQAPHSIAYNFLVPNLKGMQNFLKTSEQASSSNTEKADTPFTPPPSPRSAVDHETPPASNTSSQDPNEMPSTDGRRAPLTPPPPPSSSQEAPASTTSTQDPNEMPSRTTAPGSPSHSNKTLSPQFTTEISLFAAATEAFSKANTNCTIAESIDRFKPIISLAKSHNLRVRGYVSVALGCPYEGPNVSPQKVAEITATLLEMGADEVSVADTTGMGTAPRTQALLKALAAAGVKDQDLALHFHDTYGQALVNTVVGLEHGVRVFDSSVGGLGGCPYSKGATGNVATEDLVYCLHSLGVRTGVDVEKMAQIGKWISGELGRAYEARAGKALLARLTA